MSGLAIFSLKYKSLLKFEKDKTSEDFIKTIKTFMGLLKYRVILISEGVSMMKN